MTADMDFYGDIFYQRRSYGRLLYRGNSTAVVLVILIGGPSIVGRLH